MDDVDPLERANLRDADETDEDIEVENQNESPTRYSVDGRSRSPSDLGRKFIVRRQTDVPEDEDDEDDDGGVLIQRQLSSFQRNTNR